MQITAALLADAAAVADGKLYVHGAGWDQIQTQSLPAVHPSMALALVFSVDYDEAMTEIPFRLELLDEDDGEMGIQGEGLLTTGHGPTTRRGSPTLAPMAFTLPNLTFQKAGGYRFKVSSGDVELASIPFSVNLQRMPGMTGRPRP